MAVIVRLAQQSIFYGAPVLAVGHFFRNSWLRKRMQTASPNSDQVRMRGRRAILSLLHLYLSISLVFVVDIVEHSTYR